MIAGKIERVRREPKPDRDIKKVSDLGDRPRWALYGRVARGLCLTRDEYRALGAMLPRHKRLQALAFLRKVAGQKKKDRTIVGYKLYLLAYQHGLNWPQFRYFFRRILPLEVRRVLEAKALEVIGVKELPVKESSCSWVESIRRRVAQERKRLLLSWKLPMPGLPR
jgi:hypothetical protein